jgi:hypothetical protein
MAVALTDEPKKRTSHLRPLWHRSAPRQLFDQRRGDDLSAGWTTWQQYLGSRKQPPLPPFLKGRDVPLLWGWVRNLESFGAFELDENKSIAAVVEDVGASPLTRLPHAMRIMHAAYLLPSLAARLNSEAWWRLAEKLYDLALEAQQLRVDWNADADGVLQQQWLAGELPLALSYMFPEIRALRALRKPARAVLSEAIVELTDGQGLPHGRLLPMFGPLFGCWTRSRWLGERLAAGAWSQDAERQYEWMVRQAIRLTAPDERFLLTSIETDTGWSRSLFSTAIELAGNEGDCAAACATFKGRVVPRHIEYDADKLPKPSLDSDWSGIAVMAGGWPRSSIRLAIAYADDPVQIELYAGGERLLAGPWTTETTCDGEPVEVAGEWANLCWQTSKWCDFLELSIPLTNGLRIERQFVFGRKDQVLYLADIIVSADGTPRRIEHSFRLPLSDDVLWTPEPETRDGVLAGRKHTVAVLPLALPEWRIDPRGGSLTLVNERLVLTQETTGRAMCCPLFFDLKRKRTKKERTWRQLTVAEWMEVLPRDRAVGYRAQSGRGQWLIYRSLGPAGNRTVLGQNIAGEFCAGRFRRSGKLEEWIEIEVG